MGGQSDQRYQIYMGRSDRDSSIKKKKYISLNPVLSDIVSSSLLNSWNDENLINDTFFKNKNDDFLHYSETRRNEALSFSSEGESKARKIVEKVEKDLQHWTDDLHDGIRIRVNKLTREEIQKLWDNRIKDIRSTWEEVIGTPVLKKKNIYR